MHLGERLEGPRWSTCSDRFSWAGEGGFERGIIRGNEEFLLSLLSELDGLVLSQGVILRLVEVLSGLRGSSIIEVIHRTSLFTLAWIFPMIFLLLTPD